VSRPEALLLTGGPHPFEATTPLLAALLDEAGCTVTVVDAPDDAAARLQTDRPTLFVLNTLRWRMLDPRYDDTRSEHAYTTDPQTARAIETWVLGGGRVLACHGAPICFDDWPGWGDLLGARWVWGVSSHPPLGAFEVRITDPAHPLVAGLADAVITDECYGFLHHPTPIEPLLTGRHAGVDHPLLWEHRPGRGHVVVSLLGHGPESFEHPTHAEILRRSARHLVGLRVAPGRAHD